jgi:uncharacterized oxidoreductase
MITVSVAELRSISLNILINHGTPEDLAQQVCHGLIEANLSGHDSHGVIRLPAYIDLVKKGKILPTERPVVKKQWQATAVIDGKRGWGQSAAHLATDTAVNLAQTFGVGVATIQRCNHIGRLGEYTEKIANVGLLGMMLCNASPLVAPFGGKTRMLGTNPFSYGIPCGLGHEPILIDFATSGVAEGKLKVARAKKAKVAQGLIIDKDGNPTIEPDDFYAGGALLTMGLHKGYCLSVVGELLGGALSGNGPSGSAYYQSGNGTMVMAMQIQTFIEPDAFMKMTRDYIAQLRNSPPAFGKDHVLVPGDPERQNRMHRAQHGIDLAESTWAELQALYK